jgi:glycosyltransferase involved in cell wall biosynthesis
VKDEANPATGADAPGFQFQAAKRDRNQSAKWPVQLWNELKGLFRSGRRRSALKESENPASLLFILHKGAGGTRFTSEDLIRVMAQRYPTFVLLTALDHWSFCSYAAGKLVPIQDYTFGEAWHVDQPLSFDRLAALDEICLSYNVAVAHVRHLLGNGPELLERLHREGIPIVFSFHDFYTVCPTIQLLDENRDYCAGVCTAGPGDCPLPANWYQPPLPQLKHHYVYEHRRLMGRALALCDFFVTTSQASRELITSHFPELDRESFIIIEHGRDLAREELARAPVKGEPMRAIFFGELTPSKGLKLILNLLKENRQAGSPFELHLLGKKVGDFDPDEHGVVYHGLYERHELADHVRAIRPSVSLVPSPWPETYCHVLTESWAMGLPVLVSDIGTLRERVSRHGGGWLLPVDDAPRWFEQMCRLIDDRVAYEKAVKEVRQIKIPDVAFMAGHYEAIYARLFANPGQGTI